MTSKVLTEFELRDIDAVVFQIRQSLGLGFDPGDVDLGLVEIGPDHEASWADQTGEFDRHVATTAAGVKAVMPGVNPDAVEERACGGLEHSARRRRRSRPTVPPRMM